MGLSLSGCASAKRQEGEAEPELRIVCTVFPLYDWTAQILGEQAGRVELSLLLKDGSDLHSYQPTVEDLVTISQADVFFYVGGESDFWVEEALDNADNPDLRAVRLMDCLEGFLQEEEYVEGMAGAEEHTHDHGEEEEAYDEHIWLSLRNAAVCCREIKEVLAGLDALYAEVYRENAEAYCTQLEELDREYADIVEKASYHTLVFGDRFPFRYLTEDYGLEYYAAFPGCSAETEASFYTIAFLAEKVTELDLPAVLAIDGSDGRIAETIADNTGTRDQKVLELDSLQSVDWRDVQSGTEYLSVMEENLGVLSEALGAEVRDNGTADM